MADRITQKRLENIVSRLSKITGNTYRLDYAYGGVALENDTGSIQIFNTGHISKKALYDNIFSVIQFLYFIDYKA